MLKEFDWHWFKKLRLKAIKQQLFTKHIFSSLSTTNTYFAGCCSLPKLSSIWHSKCYARSLFIDKLTSMWRKHQSHIKIISENVTTTHVKCCQQLIHVCRFIFPWAVTSLIWISLCRDLKSSNESCCFNLFTFFPPLWKFVEHVLQILIVFRLSLRL